jgi:hypothetical protein
MAGAQVTHLLPFAPTAGSGMMISMVSHCGRCCIGINSDRAAVIDPELLTACMREGLDEMLSLRRPGAPARKRTGYEQPKHRNAAKRSVSSKRRKVAQARD